VDGQIWPAADEETIWLPAGPHSVETALSQRGPRLLYLNGELQAARVVDDRTVVFSYRSTARAIVLVDRRPQQVQSDGVDANPLTAGATTVLLPRGQHVVNIVTE